MKTSRKWIVTLLLAAFLLCGISDAFARGNPSYAGTGWYPGKTATVSNGVTYNIGYGGGSTYARETTWEFPENSASGTRAKKWYVPVWWPDGSEYTFLVAAKGAITPGGEITAAKAYTISIDDNMYTDDYTKN
ncbi:MAG: hypothetical protein Q4E65_01620 [Clostridia bacterium]|nr:hypothetical protein [Clostridia bacterium]